ncbi:ACT domain-containing protein [Aeromicrobium sp. UC242_57]|uniref:ACT domain-containing protein n=1 Tax=Aeromicrobium sp. UC242_57 TaxID=3374624 RepID=UPI00378905B8
MSSSFVLTLSCPDRPGLVFAVTRWVAEAGGNILDSQQFTDTSDSEFFLRVHFDMPGTQGADEPSPPSPPWPTSTTWSTASWSPSAPCARW